MYCLQWWTIGPLQSNVVIIWYSKEKPTPLLNVPNVSDSSRVNVPNLYCTLYGQMFTTVKQLFVSCIWSAIIIIIIISGFGVAVVPDSWVGNTWQRLTLVLHEFLSNGLTPSRLHIVISFLTHADHVFLAICSDFTITNTSTANWVSCWVQ